MDRRVVHLVEVHAEHNRDVRLLGGRRDDHLPRAGFEMLRRVCALAEEAGRLDHDIDTELLPRQAGGIRLGEDGDLDAVDDDHVGGEIQGAGERPVDAVVPEQVVERLRAHQVVEPGPLDLEAALVCRAERGATRPPHAVDRNSNSHGSSFVGFREGR